MEIKFRAYGPTGSHHPDDVDSRCFWYSDENFLFHSDDNLYANDKQNLPSDCVIEQYSGLKDPSGKEIYAGDAVPLAGYGLYIAEFPFIELYEAAAENDIGLIRGNINENPELLEE